MYMPRLIEFTNSEIANFTDHQQKLRTLSDFLWNDPRPHAEGKFDMLHISKGWSEYRDDPREALSRCGTAACACGWAIMLFDDREFMKNSFLTDGRDATLWMFGGAWVSVDNTPHGASFRIDHWLKHQDPLLYTDRMGGLMAQNYPKPAPWLEVAA